MKLTEIKADADATRPIIVDLAKNILKKKGQTIFFDLPRANDTPQRVKVISVSYPTKKLFAPVEGKAGMKKLRYNGPCLELQWHTTGEDDYKTGSFTVADQDGAGENFTLEKIPGCPPGGANWLIKDLNK